MNPSLGFTAVDGLPEVHAGDDLVALLGAALSSHGLVLASGDVIVFSQKIVSKAENRYVDLAGITPGGEARELAQRCGKDPRLVELILRESSAVVRVAPNVLIVRHRLGLVMANAGIDQSNIPQAGERVLLLPEDPDASADRLRRDIEATFGVKAAVLISDSFGRAWRMGVTGVCIGCSGMAAVVDQRGMLDRSGRALQVTQLAVADQLCASATLISGEAAEGRPVVIVRGVPAEYFEQPGSAADLIRPPAQDLFL